MPTPTVPVTVTLISQDGTPYVGAVVSAVLDGNEVYEGIIFADRQDAMTDAAGVAVLNLFPNAPSPSGLGTQGTTYRVFASFRGARPLDVKARVPNAACRLEDILVDTDAVPLSAAETAALNAQTSASAAATSASQASTSETNAAASESAAAASETAAATSETNAANSAALAQKWATQTSAEVVAGQGYGAKKYAQDAAASAADAAASAADAGPLRTDLAASTGATLVGFMPAGIGAAATTVDAFLNEIHQYSSGQFDANNGAKINRLRDRVFIAAAAENAGTNDAAQPDWLTTFLLSKGRTFGPQQISTLCVLPENNSNGQNTILSGARTVELAGDGTSIAFVGIAINNNSLHTAGAFGVYLEAHRETGALGGAYGIELDTINRAGLVVVDPYQQQAGQTVGLQIASGGEYSPADLFDGSAAISIRNNHAAFQKGIVFGNDAITGSDGTSGVGEAISFAKGHSIAWYGSSGVATSALIGLGTTTAGGTNLVFNDYSVNLQNAVSGKPSLQIIGSDTTTNYISVGAQGTGVGPSLEAKGDDANIDIRLLPKGSGLVLVGTAWAANGDAAVNGYMTVKDSAGNVRKLATIA